MARTGVAVATSAVALACAAAPAFACCHREHLMPAGMEPGAAPLAIGDSVMVGAADQLLHAGFEVDAKEGRVTHAALTILRRRLRENSVPDTVVFALGTNVPPLPDELARIIKLLGRERTLVLVTPYRGWRAFGAEAMWRAKRLHPKQIRIADWAAEAPTHPGWLWGDGTHLRPAGARGYAALIQGSDTRP